MNVQAAATFANLTDNINSSLETLRGLAEDHFVQDPDCVNWGHVGTLRAILNDVESASMRATALAFPAHITQQGLACHEPAPMVVRSEGEAPYHTTQAPAGDASEDCVIHQALRILEGRMRRPGMLMDSPSAVRDYLRLRMAELPHEEFGVLLLDATHALIEDARLFRGTLTQASVYPREVVKVALAHNAAAVILYHNHPSSNVTPSVADEMLTKTLKDALALVDVRVIDHFVVGCMTAPFSFAERGLL